MKKLSGKIIFILVGNLFVILLALFQFRWSVRHLPHVDSEQFNIFSWMWHNQVYFNDGVFINDEIRDSGKAADFLWGPYKPLKKGSYTAIIQYTADDNQICYAGDKAEGGESQHYLASRDILSKYSKSANYQFEITEDVEEFQLVVEYDGWGDFGINSISIVPNNNRAKRLFTEMIVLLILTDCLLFVCSLPLLKKQTIFILLGITVLVSLPVTVKGMFLGHDLEIHLLRIDSIAHALRSGQFPARISGLALWGLGYPFSIYYNDLFLYFPALLRLLGYPVDSAYKIYLTAINLLTVVIAYVSFRKIFKDRWIGLLLTLFYATASYRFVNVYIRSAVGEYTAQAFLPLLALAFYRIYTDSPNLNWKTFGNALLLTAALSGILGSHVLTMLMAGSLMILTALILLRKTIRRNVIITFFMTALFTIAVNLYYLVPFFDYYFNVPAFIGETVGGKAQVIQNSGAFLGQLFAFFENIAGNRDNFVDGRFQSTPGLVLMAVFLIALYLRFFRIKEKRFRFWFFFSFLTLFLSTNIFPWNYLALRFLPIRLLSQIQFPWRFLVFSILFLTLLSGEILQRISSVSLNKGFAAAAIVMSIWCVSSLFNAGCSVYYYDTLAINPERTGHEYLLAGTQWESYAPVFEYSGMESVQQLSRNSSTMLLYCKTSDLSDQHLVVVPVFNYKGYHVLNAEEQEIMIESTDQNHISFSLPNGYDGIVTVIFRDPVYWTASLWISAFFVLCLAGIGIVKRKSCF